MKMGRNERSTTARNMKRNRLSSSLATKKTRVEGDRECKSVRGIKETTHPFIYSATHFFMWATWNCRAKVTSGGSRGSLKKRSRWCAPCSKITACTESEMLCVMPPLDHGSVVRFSVVQLMLGVNTGKRERSDRTGVGR